MKAQSYIKDGSESRPALYTAYFLADTQCHRLALEDAPHNTVIDIDFTGLSSYDANTERRARLFDSCMKTAGYRPVLLPRCMDKFVTPTDAQGRHILPKLGPETCWVESPRGTKWPMLQGAR